MKLRSFEVNSYRSCIRTKFPLDNKLTGLIGINGSGKSNILNSIALLRKICKSRPSMRELDVSSRNRCRVVAEIECENKILFIRGNIIYETDERNLDEVYFSETKFNFREFTDNSNWIDFPIQMLSYSGQFVFSSDEFELPDPRKVYLPYPINDDYIMIRKSKKLRSLLYDVVSFFNGINYYSASQFSDPSRCPVSIELEDDRPLRRFRGPGGHEQFIMDLYKSWAAKNTEYKRYVNTVCGDGIGLVDNIDFRGYNMPSSSYEVKSGGKIKEIRRNRLLIVPSFTIGKNQLSPNQLSEGTFKTLALVFYILNDNSKLLLIEEPEVCVHHGLLNSILTLIKTQSKKKQIVMSTHSDFVLDHMEPDNLLLVKRSADKGTVATPLNKSMSKNDYQVLREYLQESGNLGDYWREGGLEND